MSAFIDIHIIQTLPPSCVNRDDTGTPKSATFGGTRRLRVSSQSWKHAVRKDFSTHLDKSKQGVRTYFIVDMLAQRISEIAPEYAQDAVEIATNVFKSAGLKLSVPKAKEGEEPKSPQPGALTFVSGQQIDFLAKTAKKYLDADPDSGVAAVATKEAKKAIKDYLKSGNSIDIALFGRMVADQKDLNVDASCQVAHAISTHPVDTEFDYFTAVDDQKAADDSADAGAGMIGTVDFASATVYRYATINLDQLSENLGESEVSVEAVEAFIKAFVTSMPTGKMNTFANRTLPEYVCINVCNQQPISYASAFEKPVVSQNEGYTAGSITALDKYAQQVAESYGYIPKTSYLTVLHEYVGLCSQGKAMSFPQALEQVSADVQRILGEK